MLVEDLAIHAIRLLVDQRGHVRPLPQDLHPPLLISAGEADSDASRVQLVEQRHGLGDADRIRRRQHERERDEHQPLGPPGEVREQQQRVGVCLGAFGVEVMLGRAERRETELIRGRRQGSQFAEHHLVALGVAPDRPQLPALLDRRRDGRHRRDHHLHERLLLAVAMRSASGGSEHNEMGFRGHRTPPNPVNAQGGQAATGTVSGRRAIRLARRRDAPWPSSDTSWR